MAVAGHHQPGKFAQEEFSPLTAVYLADHFCNHQKLDTEKLDLDYLDRMNLRERIEEFETTCKTYYRPQNAS